MKRSGSFLIGGLLGVGLAWLLVPRLAPDSPNQLSARAKKLKAKTNSALSLGRLRTTELMDALDDKLSQAKNKAGQVGEQARSAMAPTEPGGEKAPPDADDQACEFGEHPPGKTENAYTASDSRSQASDVESAVAPRSNEPDGWQGDRKAV